MPCTSPLTGWRSAVSNSNGKRPIVFDYSKSIGIEVTVPCGQCISCRLARSREWALRCMHESQLHEDNMFITLTYDDEHLPRDLSLKKKHFQDFMKRYRKRFPGQKIRYYHCGEYGEQFGRPHYHAIIFGHTFPDLEYFTSRNSNRVYTSDTLSDLWSYGFSTVGSVTYESAAYVARYILKKITGDQADLHYSLFDYSTGEIYGSIQPEYTTMSRRPGIGRDFYEKFKSDFFPSDEAPLPDGRTLPVPGYYSTLYEMEEPHIFREIKKRRKKKAKKLKRSDQQLVAHNEILKSRLKQLRRDIE